MTKQKPQQDWEKEFRDIAKLSLVEIIDGEKSIIEAPKEYIDSLIKYISNLLSTERTKILNEIKELVKESELEVQQNPKLGDKGNIIYDYNDGYEQALDDLLSALNKLEGG